MGDVHRPDKVKLGFFWRVSEPSARLSAEFSGLRDAPVSTTAPSAPLRSVTEVHVAAHGAL